MKYINRQGFKINFLEIGDTSSPPIVVIGSISYYSKLFANDVYKKLNLIFIDHRGFIEPEEKNTYSLEEIVEDIEALRKVLNLNHFYILGHSGHGFMAMAYATKYSKYVLGIILSNLAPDNTKERQQKSLHFFDENASKERKRFFENEMKKLPLKLENDPQHRFSHINISMQSHSFYNYKFEGSYLWDGVYNNLEALDYLWGDAFAEFDTANFISKYHKPILLLLSDYDYLIGPSSLWNHIISKTHVQLHMFKKSGHNPMLEEPSEFFYQLKLFVNDR